MAGKFTFNSFKVAWRIVIVFFVIIGISVLSGTMGIRSLIDLNSRTNYIHKNRIPDLITLSDLHLERTLIRVQTLDVFHARTLADPKANLARIINERENSWAKVDQLWTTLNNIPRMSQEGKDILKELGYDYEQWRKIYSENDNLIKKMYNASSNEEYNALFAKYEDVYKNLLPLSEKFAASILKLKNNNIKLTNEYVAEAADANSNYVLIAIISLAVGALVAVLGGMLLGLSITKPVKALVKFNSFLSAGDFSHNIDQKYLDYKDEFGQLAESKSQVVYNTRALLSAVKLESVNLEEASESLASSITQTVSAINEITVNIENLKKMAVNQSASVTETHSTMESINKQVDILDGLIADQSSFVTESSAAIEQMVANIASIYEILKKNSISMDELLKATDQGRFNVEDISSLISQIAGESDSLIEASSVIQAISSQTNLLAMNAAIEAAHAGEAGKGFAVVADEIRKLAENAAEESKSISKVLGKIKAMIDQGSDSSVKTRDQFDTILKNVNLVQEQETVIRNSMDEQSSGSTQVLTGIRQISEITLQVQDGSKLMKTGSQEILTEMQNLNNMTVELSSGMEEMAIGAGEVNSAANDLTNISSSTRNIILKLNTEIDKFKI